MKLLFFISSLRVGGAERVTSSLANYWSTKGWEVTIVTLSMQSDDCYQLNPDIHRLTLSLESDSRTLLSGLFHNFRRIMALRRVLIQINPDVALSMMEKANILLALVSLSLSSVRFIGSERTYPPQHSIGTLWESLRSFSYRYLYAVTAQTNKGAEWLKLNTSARRVIAIPNPVNWPLRNQAPIKKVESICDESRKILLAVGRLSAEKQFDTVIDCFQALSEKHTDWDLVILGDGSLRGVLEKKVNDAEMQNRIFLPGRVGNISDWYARANMYVMCSRFEGFPNTLLEAMAHGLAVVSFDCDTGPRDIIRDGLDGSLVPPDDVVALTEAMEQLMSNDALRQQFAEQAMDVRDRFAIERIAKKWEGLFEKDTA